MTFDLFQVGTSWARSGKDLGGGGVLTFLALEPVASASPKGQATQVLEGWGGVSGPGKEGQAPGGLCRSQQPASQGGGGERVALLSPREG